MFCRIKTGIYSGSFNPIHNGHVQLANYLIDNNLIDELWLIVTPKNPLKQAKCLASNQHRLEMAKLAFKKSPKIKVSDVEFSMPTPNYTIDTLNLLQSTNLDREFILFIGSDNVVVFDKWKDYEQILQKYRVLAYPRRGYPLNSTKFPQIKVLDTPLYDISSTQIRQMLSKNLSCNNLIPKSVSNYIKQHKLYGCCST